MPEPVHGRQRKAWLAPLVSYSIAAGCLYLVFRDIKFRELAESAAHIRWVWLVPAVLLDLLTYLCVAWQWQFALRPVGTLPLRKLTQAVFAGRFANDVLPVHVGYVIRVYLVSRWLGAPVARVIPSLLVERLCEGFWLAFGIGLSAAFVKLPREVLRTGEILGVILGLGVVAALVLIRAPIHRGQGRPSGRLGELAGKTLRFVQRLARGVQEIAEARMLVPVWAAGLGKLVVQALAFFSLLWAYGLALPFWVEVAVFLIACVGISLPSTPASAGVFQLFCVAGLTLFGIPKAAATGFALLAFMVLTAPLALAGFFALGRSGMSVGEVRRHAGEWREEMNETAISEGDGW